MESKSVNNQIQINNQGTQSISKKGTFDDPIHKREFLNIKPSPFTLNVLIAFCSGIFLGLSMPGYEMSVIAWFGFVPLFLLIKEQRNIKSTAILSFAFAMGFNLLALRWLLGLHPLTWMGISQVQSALLSFGAFITISAYNSLFFSLFGICTFLVQKSSFHKVYKNLMIPCAWCFIMNKLMAVGAFAFPWTCIEYSQYQNTTMIQLAKVFKGIGIGFIIIWANLIIADSVKYYKRLKKVNVNFKALIPLACMLLSLFVLGSLLFNKKHKLPDLNVTVVQSNLTIEDNKLNHFSLSNLKKYYLQKIQSAPKGIIVLPEGAYLDYLKINDKAYVNKLQQVAAKEGKTLILGIMDYKNISGNVVSTNSALLVDKAVVKDNTYDKNHLLPFGEYIPFLKYLPHPWKQKAIRFLGTNFNKGRKIKVFNTSNGNIAPNICYEILFPSITKQQHLNGAKLLVNLSNLSWFHNSIIKDYFIAFGVFRAVETGLPLIAAVNTGYSFVISDKGQIMLKLDPQTAEMKTINLKKFYEN